MPEQVELQKKNGQRSSDRQLQEAQKKTDRVITPEAEAVRVPEHLAPPGSPQAKQLSHLHTQLSLGQSCHGEKNVLHLCMESCFGCVRLCDPVNCGLPGFSVREGGFPGKTIPF